MKVFHLIITLLLIANAMIITPVLGTVGLTFKDPLAYTLLLLIIHYVVSMACKDSK